MYDRIRAGPVLYRVYRAIRFHSPPDRCFRHFPFGVSCPSRYVRPLSDANDLLPTGGVSREYSILNFDFFFCQLITVRQHSNKRKTPGWCDEEKKRFIRFELLTAFFSQFVSANDCRSCHTKCTNFYSRELASGCLFFYRSDERIAYGVTVVNRRGNCGRRATCWKLSVLTTDVSPRTRCSTDNHVGGPCYR